MINRVQNFFQKIKIYFQYLSKLRETKPKDEPKSVEDTIDDMFSSLIADEICIELSENIFDIFKSQNIGDLRQKIKEKTGFILPVVWYSKNFSLEDNEYKIYLRKNLIFEGFTVPKSNYMCAEILYNLEKTCKENIDLVFTNKVFEKYINVVQRNNQWLIWEIAQHIAPTDMRTILLDLIKMGKSIENIEFVFEQIGKFAYLRNPKNIVKNIKNSLKDFEWDVSFIRPEIVLPKYE